MVLASKGLLLGFLVPDFLFSLFSSSARVPPLFSSICPSSVARYTIRIPFISSLTIVLGGQAFSAGLVDEVAMDVVPVVLGEGVRFFGSHTGTALLDDPDQVVQGGRVLHLHYTVRR